MALAVENLSLNAPTRALRLLAILGAFAGGFWVLGFVWETVGSREPPILAALLLSAVFVAIIAALVFRLLPTAFSVQPNIGWLDLIGRLVFGALITYPILALFIGLVAAGLIRSRGFALEGEAAMAVWLLALWLPLWFLPLSASVVAWLWSRNAEAI
jgi:hypothetical protein